MSRTVPCEKKPVAVICWVSPTARVSGSEGELSAARAGRWSPREAVILSPSDKLHWRDVRAMVLDCGDVIARRLGRLGTHLGSRVQCPLENVDARGARSRIMP